MRMRRAHIPAVFAVGFVLALTAVPVAGAFASSGEITRAEANASWTLGSIEGSATWNGCPVEWGEWEPFPPYELQMRREHCRLQAFVTVGPGSEPSDCSAESRKWPHSDEQVTLVWSSEETLGSGSGTFDESEVPLSGATEQLVCLSLLETYWEQPECPPEQICPQYILVVQNYSVLASASMSAPPPPPPSPPANTEPPHVSGTPSVGRTLTCSNGAWEGAESFDRAWLRDGNPIEGEAGTTYIVQNADLGHSISCEVTATNEGGSESATSNVLAVHALPPTIGDESATSVTEHDATLGADINPNRALTKYKLQIDTTGHFKFYQSDSCVLHPPGVFCAEVIVPGEPLPPGLVEPPESTLPAGDESQHVSVDLASIGATLQPGTTYHYRAIAANGLPVVEGPERTFTTLSPSPPPSPPANTEPPHVSGTPSVGRTLTCSNGAWEGAESFDRAWLRDGNPIEGEAGTTYIVQNADLGHSISCEVTATNEGGSESATSNALAVPVPPEPESTDTPANDSHGDEQGTADSMDPPGAPPVALKHRGSRHGAPCRKRLRHRTSPRRRNRRHHRRGQRHGHAGRRACAWVSAAKVSGP